MGGTRCACVSMGGGPMPPTGSGSGSGPQPPTGSGPTSGTSLPPKPVSEETELILTIRQTWSQEPAGYDRTAKVSVPETVAGEKVPVVIHLHGNGAQASTRVL